MSNLSGKAKFGRLKPVSKPKEPDEAYTSDRTCIDCQHWFFSSGYPNLSDVTPGDSAINTCAKGHWSIESLGNEGVASARRKLKTADKCPDFEHVDYPP